MGKESITFVTENGAVDDALHITASVHLCSGDVDLIAVAICVFDGGTVNHSIETGPEGGAHAHGARFAGGVEGVSGKGNGFEALGGFADGAHFSVGAGIKLLPDGVEGAQQKLAGIGANDGSAEWAGAGSLERARGKGGNGGHAGEIRRGR